MSRIRLRHRRSGVVVAAGAALLLAGCTLPMPSPTSTTPIDGVQPAGDPVSVASGLKSPWSIVPLADGSVLIGERDSGDVVHVAADGTKKVIGTVPGVVHTGEGGLLGLLYAEQNDGTWLYAYLTTASDNRVERIPLSDEFALGTPEVLLSGLAKASNHDGGRLAFGPDHDLYVTVGDAGVTARAQDLKSLNGKILRMTRQGAVPADNPFPGSYVYSYGHRNPQGLAWDANGNMWASEFGQDTWDELNIIKPGRNYGWPIVEGKAGDPRFVDPVLEWPTSDASPSGLTYTGRTLFMAALRGQRLWLIYREGETGADPVAWYAGQYGRLRDVAPGPDGSLYFLTNNTDGRGTPKDDDDHLYQVRLAPLQEG